MSRLLFRPCRNPICRSAYPHDVHPTLLGRALFAVGYLR